MTTTTHPPTANVELHDWVKHGLIGGIIAGLVFAAFVMMMAAMLVGNFFGPLRMIGAILLGQQALQPDYPLINAALAGVGLHMVLSAMYGIIIAGVAHYVRVLSASSAALVLWASAAGLALWLVNFYVIAPLMGWVWFPNETNPVVQFIAHTFFFGTVLGLYLNAMARRG